MTSRVRDGFWFLEVKRLSRISELNPVFSEALHQCNVYQLLNIHVAIVVAVEHVVHDLEIQAEVPEFDEVSTIESDAVNDDIISRTTSGIASTLRHSFRRRFRR